MVVVGKRPVCLPVWATITTSNQFPIVLVRSFVSVPPLISEQDYRVVRMIRDCRVTITRPIPHT